ncbi:S41 family peptidase [Galbibacter sp. EGI 63066]|uniref:S41 family peptidase n=1 Tax=Galbibacter sp. EGI 63066 TaxID=2993559 RepID=UPI002248EC78|nr:S41 family peptidase [Galbibacter sp. EGI 63066]MCX2678533.1 S41 family peptidase [Galbibacter sp. EGI 63066]
MMYLIKKLKWVFLLLLVFSYSCSKDDDNPNPNPEEEVVLENPINDFIWSSMNYWYYWQGSVNDLADSKDDNQDDYYTYLNGFDTPEGLFSSLKHADDDFSWYIPDVEAQLNEFRGISESYGLNISLQLVRKAEGSNEVVTFVSYVVPNSPASDAGIQRGDIVYKVDGTVLNDNNYLILNNLFTETSITLGFGHYENGDFVPDASDIDLTAVQLSEDPVHHTSIIEENGKNIGYMVYNSFTSTYNGELNDAFGTLVDAGIDELILDLRYNGGGSVLTSAFLASMIDGSRPAESENSIFALLLYNNKRNSDNALAYPFFDQVFLYDKSDGSYTGNSVAMNRLNSLNRLYVITSDRTASASEMIINGLRPYMDVVLVGDVTTGKNEGSITVVDAPADNDNEAYTNLNNRSSDHTVGLQPIVFHIFNSQEESNYGDGFTPDVSIQEAAFTANILPFGDPNEALLRATLDHLGGVSAKSQQLKSNYQLISKAKVKGKKFNKEMYVLPGEEQFLNKQ